MKWFSLGASIPTLYLLIEAIRFAQEMLAKIPAIN